MRSGALLRGFLEADNSACLFPKQASYRKLYQVKNLTNIIGIATDSFGSSQS